MKNLALDFTYDYEAKMWTITDPATLNEMKIKTKLLPYPNVMPEDYFNFIENYVELEYPEITQWKVTGMYPEHNYLRFMIDVLKERQL